MNNDIEKLEKEIQDSKQAKNSNIVSSVKAKDDISTKKIKAKELTNAETVSATNRKYTQLSDNVIIRVKSNTYGILTYVNPKTGDTTIWEGYGDVQDMTVADLRAMRGSNIGFFSSCLVYLMECIDNEYCDWTPKDLYNGLNIHRYYKDIVDIEDVESVFAWSPEEMRARIPQMPSGIKSTLVVGANTMIKDGRLDSMQKIKVLEEVLKCELGEED